jgi:predicted ester cyclase
VHRDTIRKVLGSPAPPSYGRRSKRPSKLDPFLATIEELLADEPTLSGVRMREELERLGTHQGEYMGIPPTGKSVTYSEIFIVRFARGRIAETWGVVDVFSQIRQLGVRIDWDDDAS